MQLLLGGQQVDLIAWNSCFENYNTKIMPLMSPSVSSMPLHRGGLRCGFVLAVAMSDP
jgi:hypothetical protein